MAYKKFGYFCSFISTFILILFTHPALSLAHSVLLEAYPSINSQVDHAPTEIRLKFNERLEKELYYIHVFDEQGKLVTGNETRMNENQTELSLVLPPLKDGNYTVSYQVISADGHPVSQGYLISVGNVLEKYDPNWNASASNHGDAFNWFLRTLYYAAFLSLIGFLLWKYLFSIQDKVSDMCFNLWFKYIKWAYFSFVVIFGVLQFLDVSSKFGIGGVPAAFFFTTAGRAWCASLILISLGIFLFGKSSKVDFLIAFILIVAEGVNGHAVTYHPIWLNVFLDMVHLVASAIWVGGLGCFLVLWKGSMGQGTAFLQLFSKWALWSVICIVGTGTLMTILFLPTYAFLVHTQWGVMILSKVILVSVIIIVASFIRKHLHLQYEEKFQFWLKWDYTILIMIMFIVGGLTNTSPIPSNDPLVWVERQNNELINMEITPNNPGVNNTFNVMVELQKGKKVKNLELNIMHLGEPQIAPISVPMKSRPNNVPDMNRYFFSNVGPFLSMPGDWEVEINVFDENDDLTTFKKKTTIYPVQKN